MINSQFCWTSALLLCVGVEILNIVFSGKVLRTKTVLSPDSCGEREKLKEL